MEEGSNTAAGLQERPVMMQGSEAPIIIREGTGLPDLICSGCEDSVLVRNYLAECLVGIGLQCFKCGHITWTPSLPKGETFPRTPVSLGRSGKYLIGSSVVNRQDVVLTCDQELESASKLTSPSNDPGNNLELSPESLERISSELDILSGGRFKKYLESACRSLKHREGYFRENPLAWSIELLKKQLADNVLHMNNPTLVALGFLQGYRNVLERWRRHVYFPVLANEICAYFYHSLFQLIAASYLFDYGNNVAINIAQKKDGERSADLYIRLSGSKKLFLEVKCPQTLEWTNTNISSGKMKKSIEKCLSTSRGQIDKESPGILVVGTTCLDNNFLAEFEKVVDRVLKTKGSSYSAVAAICVIGLQEVRAGWGVYPEGRVSTSFGVSITRNAHYFEENPIVT